MAIGRMFKLPQHKEFNYRPRYYDEKRERRDKLIARLKAEAEAKENADPDARSGINIRAHYNTRKGTMDYKQQIRNSNIRLGMIVTLLSGILYFILR